MRPALVPGRTFRRRYITRSLLVMFVALPLIFFGQNVLGGLAAAGLLLDDLWDTHRTARRIAHEEGQGVGRL